MKIVKFVYVLLLIATSLSGCGGGGGGSNSNPQAPTPLSSNANLSSLSVQPDDITPAFDLNVLSYNVVVDATTDSVSISATTADSNAQLSVNGTSLGGGTVSTDLSLNAGTNVVELVVTAQDGTTRKTYTVSISRPLHLSSLVVSEGVLAPAFGPETLSYEVTVQNPVSAVAFTLSTPLAGATITVNGSTVSSGAESQAVDLAVGDTIVDIALTSSDSAVTTNYSVTVHRISADAELSDLVLSSGGLNEAFDSQLLSYSANTSFLADSVAVRATASDSLASLTINGDQATSGTFSSPIALDSASTLIEIAVTAEDGTTTNNYSITVSRDDFSTLGQRSVFSGIGITGDDFGHSISSSGRRIVVGAQGQINAEDAAYVYFRNDSGNWVQEARLTASNAESGDGFGFSVSISGDTLVVGAPGEDSGNTGMCESDGLNNDISAAGAVYIFVRDSQGWQQDRILKGCDFDGRPCRDPAGTNAPLQFGKAVSIYGDQLAVSKPGTSAIQIFQQDASNYWSPSGCVFRPGGPEFGQALSLHDDALAAGGPSAAYVYRKIGGTWVEEASLSASNADVGDRFGYSVSLLGDWLAVGAMWEESAATGINGDQTDNSLIQAGAVYMYENTGDSWVQHSYIKASNTGGGDDFGSAVGLFSNYLVVGAQDERSGATGINGNQDDDCCSGTGAAYLFVRSPSDEWSQIAYIKASGPTRGFGSALTISEFAIGISANNGVNPGEIYIFD